MAPDALERVDRLKNELDKLRPLPPDVVGRVEQKLRIESNYHSNAVEGNSLTLGETRSLILHGLTARGKPMRDHLDIQGHDDAVKAIERNVADTEELNEVFIRNLHRVLLKEPYDTEAITPDGQHTRRPIALGEYKTMPNNVKTSTGEIYYFTPPEQVKPAMTDLIDWYRDREAAGEHPVIVAATFHYRFVRIHPFDDGNGRMARLLMNLILIKHDYTVAIVQTDDRERYLHELEQADKIEDLSQFIDFIASRCIYALNLHIRAARGESIEDPQDIDREITLFKRIVAGRGEAGSPAVRCAFDARRQRVALRQYANEIAYPLYRYFESKIDSTAIDLFHLAMGPLMRFVGTSIDGSSFQSQVHGNDPTEMDTVPEFVSDVTVELICDLNGFRKRTQENLHFHVDNALFPSASIWRFRLEGTCSYALEDYDGQDLDELKTRINQLLRRSMHVMKQWSISGD